MIKVFNPWENMGESSMRRVDSNLNYNMFWILDITGKYGFCIQSNTPFTEENEPISLKGISVVRRNETDSKGSLYLILNDKEEWQIFYTLCEDLINTAKKFDDSKKIIEAVEIHLKKWHQLLKNDSIRSFTIEKQMGLFGELICLKNTIVPEYGINQAIQSWVGPDFDKQDFLLDHAVIEIKSYKTTKGEVIYISSLQQLQSPKEKIYLIANGLTTTNNGVSVKEVVESIKNLINDEATEELFELKLNEYGYISQIISNQQLYKFKVDKQKVYKINSSFPKILRGDVASPIVEVKYGVDLTQCREYEVEIEELYKERVIK